MAVYFIRAGNDGPVKIGYTAGGVRHRLRNLQTGSPMPMSLIRLIEGDRETELEIHEQFAHHRLNPRKEWFHFDDAMMVAGKVIELPARPGRIWRDCILAHFIKETSETQAAFAARAGLSDSTLSRLLAGKSPPSPEVVERVHKATAGQVTANDLFATWRAAAPKRRARAA